jgi:uncharacterized protein (TIGR02300 family)
LLVDIGFDSRSFSVYGDRTFHPNATVLARPEDREHLAAPKPEDTMRLTVAKPELGTKRICPETGRKFYDLNKDPVVSPYTGQSYPRSYFESGSPAEDEEEIEEKEIDEVEEGDVDTVSLEEADEEVKGGSDVADVDEDDVDLDDDDDTFLADDEDEDEDGLDDIIGVGDDDDDA